MGDNCKITIGTLNFNGETYWSINKRFRLPQSLFDIHRIKENLTALTRKGLPKILHSFDIIAVQELLYSPKKERDAIEKVIKDNGYELLTPKGIGARAHFAVGFIVKQSLFEQVSIPSEPSTNLPKNRKLPNNRAAVLKFKLGEEEYSIVNMHVNDYEIDIPAPNGNVILLGDMNAYTKNQSSDKRAAENDDFLAKIVKCRYHSIGKDTDYTWESNGVKKKLDHIFVSKKLLDNNEIESSKDDSVNFYGKENGFTDHSMLILKLKEKKQ